MSWERQLRTATTRTTGIYSIAVADESLAVQAPKLITAVEFLEEGGLHHRYERGAA